MKYSECRKGMRVVVHDDSGGPDRIGTIEELHPVMKLAGRLPPGAPPFVTNVVSVRWDKEYRETAPGGQPVAGTVVEPEWLEPMN